MEHTQTYLVNCNGKPAGNISITKNDPNYIGSKVASALLMTKNVFGNVAPQILADLFDSLYSDKDIIEAIIKKANIACTEITFQPK